MRILAAHLGKGSWRSVDARTALGTRLFTGSSCPLVARACNHPNVPSIPFFLRSSWIMSELAVPGLKEDLGNRFAFSHSVAPWPRSATEQPRRELGESLHFRDIGATQ